MNTTNTHPAGFSPVDLQNRPFFLLLAPDSLPYVSATRADAVRYATGNPGCIYLACKGGHDLLQSQKARAIAVETAAISGAWKFRRSRSGEVRGDVVLTSSNAIAKAAKGRIESDWLIIPVKASPAA